MLYITILLDIHILVGGIPSPLKNMKVNWDDDYSQYMGNKSHVPNHQPGIEKG